MNEKLVFDLGFHNGEDTDFYLRKGFSVIAIEANPTLVANAKVRFQDAMARGKLHLIAGAIAPSSAGEHVVFYANRDQSVWGTIVREWASRNEMLGSPSETHEVKRVDIAEAFRTYGIPFYLKVDVEGLDHFVLEELRGFQDRPHYVSLESQKVDFDQLKVEFGLIKALGYKKFKVVQQQNVPGTKIKTRTLNGEPLEYEFAPDGSGPFGDDLPGPWLTQAEALQEYRAIFRRYKLFGDRSQVRKAPKRIQKIIHWLYRKSTGYEGPLPGWFDTHASL